MDPVTWTEYLGNYLVDPDMLRMLFCDKNALKCSKRNIFDQDCPFKWPIGPFQHISLVGIYNSFETSPKLYKLFLGYQEIIKTFTIAQNYHF